LTLWKKNWPAKEAQKNNTAADRLRDLRKEITVMRRQGEPPAKDPHSFGQFTCDLCNTAHPIPELRQCVLCGRWACDSCWKDEYYTCRSCAGLIRIRQVKGE